MRVRQMTEAGKGYAKEAETELFLFKLFKVFKYLFVCLFTVYVHMCTPMYTTVLVVAQRLAGVTSLPWPLEFELWLSVLVANILTYLAILLAPPNSLLLF